LLAGRCGRKNVSKKLLQRIAFKKKGFIFVIPNGGKRSWKDLGVV
jgi:hypothetical protein